MLILLSSPDNIPNETALLNRMLEANACFIFHLRKPFSDLFSFEKILSEINPAHHPRIVVHQHYELDKQYNLKGIHFTEENRKKCQWHNRVVSTSFHILEEAQTAGKRYTYFFCSPVFSSISKPGHSTLTSWDISDENAVFRQQAIALGGVDLSKQDELQKRGFHHVAVLGAVWHAEDPEIALYELCTAYQR